MEGVLKQWFWLVRILGIFLCAYFLAKISNVYVGRLLEVHRSIGVVAPPTNALATPQTRPDSDFAPIVERNIFDSSEAAPTEAGVEGTAASDVTPTGEAVKTSLPIKVLAVMVVGEGKDKRSSTTIDSGGKTDAYAVGDDMALVPGAKLVLVKPYRIEFSHNGRLEYAELDLGLGDSIFGPPKATMASGEGVPVKPAEKEGGVQKQSETKFAIDQKEIENALSNPEVLYTEIRAVPNFENGKVSGMKILSIKPGSIFSKLGLKRGDVLQQINGMELDVKQGFQIFSQLKDQKTFNLNLQRDGSKTTMEYEIR